MLWELATLTVPYEAITTVWGVRDAVLQGQRPPLPSDTPSGYNELLQACWSGLPAQRPAFKEVLALLEEIANAERKE